MPTTNVRNGRPLDSLGESGTCGHWGDLRMRKTKRLAGLTGLVLTAALGVGAAVVQPWVTPRRHALAACEAFAHAGFGDDHTARGTRSDALGRAARESEDAAGRDPSWTQLSEDLAAVKTESGKRGYSSAPLPDLVSASVIDRLLQGCQRSGQRP